MISFTDRQNPIDSRINAVINQDKVKNFYNLISQSKFLQKIYLHYLQIYCQNLLEKHVYTNI